VALGLWLWFSLVRFWFSLVGFWFPPLVVVISLSYHTKPNLFFLPNEKAVG
jgi:hypothetical protein